MLDTNYDYDFLVEQQLVDLLESTIRYEPYGDSLDDRQMDCSQYGITEYGEGGFTWTANPYGAKSEKDFLKKMQMIARAKEVIRLLEVGPTNSSVTTERAEHATVNSVAPSKPNLSKGEVNTSIPKIVSESLESKSSCFHASEAMPFDEIKERLSEYGHRRMLAVREAEAEEIKIYGDINTEAFLATRFNAVIDWLDLKFTVDPKKCDFWFKPKARSFIKAFITRHTGIRHYVADKSEVIQDGASFTIRLHDVDSRKSLRKITALLSTQYGCKVEDMTIEAIELSLDFYNARNSALLIALHKSLKYPPVVNRMRVYKTKKTERDVPESPHELHALLEDGYNLATGDHRREEFCTRIYFKRTDKNGMPLAPNLHRLRVEVTLRKTFFEKAKIDCGLDNLPMLITHGFKQLTFTKLSNKATEEDRKNYRDLVQPFGQEQRVERSSSGHKRRLSDEVESFGMLNERKRLSVKALADKFKVRKNR